MVLEISTFDKGLLDEIIKESNFDKLAKRGGKGGTKTELLKGPLGGALANAIVGEAKSRDYKSIGFIDEDQFICIAIEWYSKEFGTDWDKLADKNLGQGSVKSFSPENAKKILKTLKQMREKPKETADNINRLLAENLFQEYEIDEEWATQILDQIIEVVEEAINKNLELVVCLIPE